MAGFTGKTMLITGASAGIGRALGVSPMREAHSMSAAECAQLIIGAMRRRERR